MLDMFFIGMASFLHATALVGADGVDAATFVPYARRMVTFLHMTLDSLAASVDTGDHNGTEDNLVMEEAFLDHVVTASRERSLNPSIPTAVHALVAEAMRRGHGGDGFSRVIHIIRDPAFRPVRSLADAGG